MNDKKTYQLQCLLEKARETDFACVLLSNDFEDFEGRWQLMAGFGVERRYHDLEEIGWDQMNLQGPIFGYVGYDYKNRIEPILHSEHDKLVEFEDLGFVSCKEWVAIERNGAILGDESLLNKAREMDSASQALGIVGVAVNWREHTAKADYISTVIRIKEHIVAGDFYEMNYCVAFSADVDIDAYDVFLMLNEKAPAPFAVFLKDGDRYLLCASPERFLSKRGEMIMSQPIKGTRRRAAGALDLEIIEELRNSEKDRAENVMIVDLVRNDLSKVSITGTVQVPECCEIYSFSHVHQMISTVTGILKPESTLANIIHATFPMGSMTGAPKIAVMQHAEKYENFSRGLYSGAVGYLWNGEFDFNVVIRAMQYDAELKKLAYAVGGAITCDSEPEQEYQECLDKAAAILSVFAG